MDATGLPGAGPGLVLSIAEPLYPLATLSALVGDPVDKHSKSPKNNFSLKQATHFWASRTPCYHYYLLVMPTLQSRRFMAWGQLNIKKKNIKYISSLQNCD